jgi:hypothetical protein
METNQPEEFFSEDPIENIKIENAIKKLKLQAERGTIFNKGGKLPPLIEKVFLQQIEAFEKAMENVRLEKVYVLIGKPSFVKSEFLNDDQIRQELKRLFKILNNHCLRLVTLSEQTPRTIYKFLTPVSYP